MKTVIRLVRPLATSRLPRVALAAGLGAALGLVTPDASFAQTGARGGAGGTTVEATGEHCAGHRGARGRHGRHGFRGPLFAGLDLSDAQRAQIRQIMQEARAHRGEGDPRARRAQIHERIQAVLTPAQRQRAQELRADRQRAHLERRVSRMTERLSLSAQQQQQVRSILQNAAMQRRALREQAENDPHSARSAMRELQERTQASVRSVLTPAQQAQLDQLRARRAERGRRGHGGPRGR